MSLPRRSPVAETASEAAGSAQPLQLALRLGDLGLRILNGCGRLLLLALKRAALTVKRVELLLQRCDPLLEFAEFAGQLVTLRTQSADPVAELLGLGFALLQRPLGLAQPTP